MFGLTGCVSIPSGKEVVSRKTDGEKVISSSASESVMLSGDTVDGMVKFQLFRVTETEEGRVAQQTTTYCHKRLMVGLYPGVFANWYGGYRTLKKTKITGAGDYARDGVSAMVLGVPLINTILLGLPTVMSWFEESGCSWKPPAKRGGPASEFAAIGWAKTSANKDTVVVGQPLAPRTQIVRTPLAGVGLNLSIPGTSASWTSKTDANGIVEVEPSRWAGGGTALRAQTTDGHVEKIVSLQRRVGLNE